MTAAADAAVVLVHFSEAGDSLGADLIGLCVDVDECC